MRNKLSLDEFHCANCRRLVSTNPRLAGVNNRNHCPYCLWSRHLDLYRAGDRLSACKARMQPVGLTLKRVNKRYGQVEGGELMLIHRCNDCGSISINRIAADDDEEKVLEVYEQSQYMARPVKASLAMLGIALLGAESADLISVRLFGYVGLESDGAYVRGSLSPSTRVEIQGW
jgi:hypothetical protein